MRLIASLLILSIFKETSQMTPAPLFSNCNDNVDIILVADASQSVAGSFAMVQSAVNAFITEITSNNPNIRIGLVFYNDAVQTLGLTTDAIALQSFVNGQTGGSGNTRTDLGIQQATSMLTSRVVTYPSNIVVITDAISQLPSQTASASSAARASDYKLFAVGVNVDAAFETELFDITGDQGRIFKLASPAQISETVVELARSICAYTVCSGCSVDFGSRRAPHPTRCDKFYICEQRSDEQLNAYEKHCGVGTLWHRRYLTCVPTWMALNSAIAGCGYCRGTKTTYPIADYCQIYYTCALDGDGRQSLNVNCCPAGQSYDDATGSCTSLGTTCSSRRYKDSVSCRSFYSCTGATNQEWTRDCCASGEFYNFTADNCVASTSCIGGCFDATMRPCGYLINHPTNKCMFRVSIAGSTVDMQCAGYSSFQESVCGCVYDETCPAVVPPSDCQPDLVIPFNTDQTKPWGFTESSSNRRWIDVKGVNYVNGEVTLNGRAFLNVPFYSNNDQALKEDTSFFRVSVRDDFVSGSPRNSEMTVLTNEPCAGSYSEAENRASVWITLQPNTGRVTFGVRSTSDETTVTVDYTPGTENAWKQVTLRYTQSSGLLEGNVLVYQKDASGNRITLQEQGNSATATSGRILTSDCGIHIGQGNNQNLAFVGSIDNILFYDDCKSDVPAVDAANPTSLD